MGLLIKVWDLPTRLFHWLLVLLMSASVLSAWVWENMVWHANCGYALLALWLFRCMWGFTAGIGRVLLDCYPAQDMCCVTFSGLPIGRCLATTRWAVGR